MARAAAHQTAAVTAGQQDTGVGQLATADTAGEELGRLQGLPGLCWACPAGIQATKLHAGQRNSSRRICQQGQQRRGGEEAASAAAPEQLRLPAPPACSHQAIHCCFVKLPLFSVPSSCWSLCVRACRCGEACTGMRMRLDRSDAEKGPADGFWPAPGPLRDASVQTFKPTTWS
jgi:hypothetical protein